MITTETSTVPSPTYRVTVSRVVHSEWAKFLSLRSSWITLGLSALFLVAIGAIGAALYSPDGPLGGERAADGTAMTLALAGTNLAALAIGALGVLMSAGEYSTGMVRSTFAAVPTRLPVLWAKCLVLGPIAFAVTTLGAVASFLIGSTMLRGEPIALGLGDDAVVRCLAGAGIYLGFVGIFGVAIGFLLRNTAGGIAILAAAVLVLPGLTGLLPSSIGDAVNSFLPSAAGQSLITLHPSGDGMLSPAMGALALVIWAVVLVSVAARRLRRSDI